MFVTIPMEPIANHRFSAVVPIDGGNVKLGFFLRYNELAKYWTVDISKDGKTVLTALPLIPAQNILEMYDYLGIGSAWIVPKANAKHQWPQAADFASDWAVVWGDTP